MVAVFQKFAPVTITLETAQEVADLMHALQHASKTSPMRSATEYQQRLLQLYHMLQRLNP